MKHLQFTFFFLVIFIFNAVAQIPPEAFNYSGLARDAQSNPVVNSNIGIQITILENSTTGPIVYQENHVVPTDNYGLFNLVIGAGAVQQGQFSTIAWPNSDYFLEVGMDITGGVNFSSMGTTQFVSVPYAIHSATTDSLIGFIPFSGNYNDLTNQPITVSSISSNGDTLTLSNGQTFVSFSGDYNNLLNQPLTVSYISANGDSLVLSDGQIFIDHSIGAGISIDSLSLNEDTIFLSNGQLYTKFFGNYNDLINQPITVDSLSATGDTLYLSNGQVFFSGINSSGGSSSSNGVSALNLPLVTTNPVTNITSNGATYSGVVANSNGHIIMETGFVYSTSPNPNVNSSKIPVGSSASTFDTTTCTIGCSRVYGIR